MVVNQLIKDMITQIIEKSDVRKAIYQVKKFENVVI